MDESVGIPISLDLQLTQNLGCLRIYIETWSLPHVPIPPNYKSSKMCLPTFIFQKSGFVHSKTPVFKITITLRDQA